MKNNINLFLKSALMTAVVSATLSLYGCGGSSGDTQTPPTPTGPDAFVEGTAPRFDPIISDLPFNTDFIFAKAAATDGTADVGAATDAVRSALNVMDGFSTTAYFDVMISGSVDPATAIPLKSVFLVEVNTGGKDALNPANIIGLVGPANFDVKVVSLDGGTNNAVRLRPLVPLKAKAKYLVFLTDDLKDTSGKALTRSWTYNALRDPSYAAFDTLLPVRNALIGWEALASGFIAAATAGQVSAPVAKEKLLLTYTFTTTDPLTPLVAMASPRAAVAGLQIAAGAAPAVAVGAALQLDAAGALPSPKARSLKVSPMTGIDFTELTQGLLAGNVGKLYTGAISLPYYQTTPAGLEFGKFLTKNWKPDVALASLLGVTLPKDVNGSYNLTYRFPFAAKTADEIVPLQVTLPLPSWVPGYAGSANCSQIYAATGYPLVIYVHGITSERSSGVALMHTLASQCIATVAIDLPLHGVAANNLFAPVLNVEKSQLIPYAAIYGDMAPHERHFNVAGAAGAPAPMNFANPGANDGSGTQFTNLGYMANMRDNNREAVVDFLNLSASLGNLKAELAQNFAVSVDTNNVYVVGVSLGGILGGVFTTANQVAIANEMKLGMTPVLTPLRGLVLASSGAQVSQIMINSPTFGPSIDAGLAASGVMAGTANYERFVYAAQSMLDSGDVVSFAQTLGQLGVPVLAQQIKDDQVIVNSTPRAPLAGTEALARLMGAKSLGAGGELMGVGLVRMNAGGHTSLLRPEGGAPQVTAELQTQVATFILYKGKPVIGAAAPENVMAP